MYNQGVFPMCRNENGRCIFANGKILLIKKKRSGVGVVRFELTISCLLLIGSGSAAAVSRPLNRLVIECDYVALAEILDPTDVMIMQGRSDQHSSLCSRL